MWRGGWAWVVVRVRLRSCKRRSLGYLARAKRALVTGHWPRFCQKGTKQNVHKRNSLSALIPHLHPRNPIPTPFPRDDIPRTHIIPERLFPGDHVAQQGLSFGGVRGGVGAGGGPGGGGCGGRIGDLLLLLLSSSTTGRDGREEPTMTFNWVGRRRGRGS